MTSPAAAAVVLTARQRSYRVAVVSLVVLTGIWRLVAMVQWSWWIDDWSFVERAYSMPFDQYVTMVYNDHLQPGQFAILWVITRIDPLNYDLAVAAVWAISMASLVVWALLFRSLFGERWAAVVGLVPVALAPGFVPIVVWTAAGLTTYVLQLFLGLTMLAALGWFRRGSRVSFVLTLLSFALGLFFWQKALLIPVAVLGLGLLLCRKPTGRLAWGRLLGLAVGLGVMSVGYLALYLSARRASGSVTTSFIPRSLGEAASFYWSAFSQDLLPGLSGGPWPSSSQTPTGLLLPTTAAQWLVLGASVGLVVWGLSRRRRGWIPVVTAAVYTLLSMGLLLVSTRYDYSGVYASFDFRYAADSLVVMAVMGTLLLVPAVGEIDPLRHGARPLRLAPWVAPAVGVALLAFSLTTSSMVWDGFAPRSPKPYVDALFHDARASRSQSVLDAYARPDVFNGYLSGKDALLSHMLAPLAIPLRWDEPAQNILVVAPDGHFRPGQLDVKIASAPGPLVGCGYLIRPGETRVIPMNAQLFVWGWGVEVGYYSRDGGVLTITSDNRSVTMRLTPGLARHQAVLEDSVRHVTVSSSPSSGAICLDVVQVGLLNPSAAPAATTPSGPAAGG